jgi:formate hydrogenlyase subunit 3/multisubunit Na+/H+ antiporter MnhD subunit
MKIKYAPLDSTFMLVSIIGFFVSVFYVYQYLSASWGFTFTLFFVMMFIASIVSMTKADTSPDSIDSLAIKTLKNKKK